ncbi:MAG: TSUP family transporter [Myxococcaceae bacterium]|nr:TSUP family transporter [Myxococcaceae bacterium]
MGVVALALLVLVSFFVEAAAGFGSMVVALTVGAQFMPVDALLGVLVPVNLVLSVYLVLRGRAHVDWRFLGRRVAPLMALGLLAGTLLTRVVDGAVAKPAFGAFVVVVAAWQLKQALAPVAALRPLPEVARVSGLVGAGVIHGVFATGGPLAVFVSARELPDKHAFRATLSALWVVMNGLVMPRLVRDGAVTASTLTTSALLLVPLALGIVLGERAHAALDERRFRVVVAALLLVAGLGLLGGSLHALLRGDTSAAAVGTRVGARYGPSTTCLEAT